MQCDTVSNQMQLYHTILRHLFSYTSRTGALMSFQTSHSYDAWSYLGPFFDDIVRQIQHDLFVPVLGEEFWTKVAMEDLAQVFSQYFDKLIIDWDAWNDELLWKGRTQQQLLGSIVQEMQKKWDTREKDTQASLRSYRAWNIFFQGALPGFLGFDPWFTLPGSAATLNMGRVVRLGAKGRAVKAASYRMVTDMSDDSAFTILPGGGSGDRFTLWYNLDRSWADSCRYKNLQVDPSESEDPSPREITQRHSEGMGSPLGGLPI